MTPVELIADYKTKKALAESTKEAADAAFEELDRKANQVSLSPYDARFDEEREPVDALYHTYNLADSRTGTAFDAMRERVFELRRQAESLWFKREQALDRSPDPFYRVTQEQLTAAAAYLEQGIREAFAGVKLLIEAIGWDPQRDLVDEE